MNFIFSFLILMNTNLIKEEKQVINSTKKTSIKPITETKVISVEDKMVPSELIWGTTANTIKKGHKLIEWNAFGLSPAIKWGITDRLELGLRWYFPISIAAFVESADKPPGEDTSVSDNLMFAGAFLPLGLHLKYTFLKTEHNSLAISITLPFYELIYTHTRENWSFTIAGHYLPSFSDSYEDYISVRSGLRVNVAKHTNLFFWKMVFIRNLAIPRSYIPYTLLV
jgi:hypothetical protein